MDYSPHYARFRALLRRMREEAGLTQSQLAAKLGKPQTFVSKSELGERRVDFLEALNMCSACGTTGAEFIVRLEKPASEREGKRTKRRSPRRMDSEGQLTGS